MNSLLRSKLISLSECLSLIQIVNEATHFSHSGNPSIIDFFFLSSSIKLVSCDILPPISSSDHNTILFSISSENHSQPIITHHSVLLYNDADFNYINFLLDSVAWKDILPSNDANTSWLIFKYIYLTIVRSLVPQKTIYSRSSFSHPWINREYINRVKKKNRLYRAAKKSNSEPAWSKFRILRNHTLSYLRLYSLSAKSNPCSFWSSVKKTTW